MNIRKKKILITGSLGYIGQNLVDFLKKDESISIFESDIKESDNKNYYKIDITIKDDLKNTILEIKPSVIIHLAGIKNLEKCEQDPNFANKINYIPVKDICDIIKENELNIHVIFMSSDYVFDGNKGNYKEDSKPNPTTVYGLSKLESEKYLQKNIKNSTICRTSNVYGIGSGFFDFIFTKAIKKEKINAFSDAMISPTYIAYLCCSLKSIIENNVYGIIHIAGNEYITRCEFAKKINNYFKLNANIIPDKIPKESKIAKKSTLNSEYSQKLINCKPISIDDAIKETNKSVISPYFTHTDERGNILGITNDENWEEINFIETEKNKTRGNHYHKNTKEGIFILEGLIKVSYLNIKTNNTWVEYYQKGDFFIIYPYINHTFLCLEKSSWINMLSKKMENKPDISKIE